MTPQRDRNAPGVPRKTQLVVERDQFADAIQEPDADVARDHMRDHVMKSMAPIRGEG